MSVPGVHPYVQANWVKKLSAAGLSYWPYEAIVLSNFWREIEAASLTDKLIYFAPFCGKNSVASKYKLKRHTSDVDVMPVLAAGYPETHYSPRTGVTANQSFVLDTGFVPSTMLAAGAWGAANASVMFAMGFVYQSKAQGFVFGVDDSPNSRLSYTVDTAGAQFIAADPLTNSGGSNYAGAVGTGRWIINRTSNTAFKIFKNGATFATGSSTDNSAHTLPARSAYIAGWNNDGSTLTAPASDRFCYAAFGQGFTDADCLAFDNALRTLMQGLRRPLIL